jgi:hypothetical protein
MHACSSHSIWTLIERLLPHRPLPHFALRPYCCILHESLFAGEIDGQPVSGTVKIEEISESSLDDFDVRPSNVFLRLNGLQFEVSTTSEEPLRRKVKEHAKGLRKSISAVFTEIVEEMKSAW